MVKLSNTDYVIWDKTNDHLVRFHSDNAIVIYSNKEEAEEDCYGNEYVTKLTDLPKHHQEEIINQFKNN